MNRLAKIATIILCAAVFLNARAESGRVFITAKQIASAIDAAGIHVSSDQITLLANVVSAKGNPILKLRSVQRWGEQRVMARLECVDPGDCLPFVVAIRIDPAGIDQGAIALSPILQPAASRAAPSLIRAGSRLTLLLEGKHVRIRLPVISLENGAIGQSIRVKSVDRPTSYEAQVVSSSILRGTL
jgi:Chaperone for flagella basal body P-ring formation